MSADPALLWRLVDAGEIDELFSLVTMNDMAQAYLRDIRRNRPAGEDLDDDDPNWGARDLWWESKWWADADRVRAGLLALVAAAETEDELGQISAGPLENFVSDDPDDLQWLELQCAISPKLRVALAVVWCFHVSAVTLSRLDSAAGVKLSR